MGKWITKLLGTAILTHGFLIWIGPEIVMRKLDRDLEAAKMYVEECGERWKNGVFYINPSCLSNKSSARKPNPDFLYYLIPYDFEFGLCLSLSLSLSASLDADCGLGLG